MIQKSDWKFYKNSEEGWQAMLDAIERAKESIDLEQFIFFYDSIGIKFLNALKAKTAEGIKVRIFCDAVGSSSLSSVTIEKELKDAGIKIKFFNSIVPWHPNNETLWYFRDHRKLMIIDRAIGFTGGLCLGEEMRGWRESYVKISGPVVFEMLESFEIMWNRTYREVKYYLKKKRIDPVGSFRYLTNSPLPAKRHMYRELIKAIRSAKHYIYLTTPYFLPDSRLLRNLKLAAERGVLVRLIVPFTTNHLVVDIGMGTFFEDVLKAGIKISRYTASMIHSKTAVIDGNWSTIGSLNLDNLSLRYNFEGNIVSTDKEFSFELEKQFLNDLKLSTELTLPYWQKRSVIRKIAELFIWPIRKLL
ncbi:MAG TPA: phosphatidylserine/phosphatidylglycerophosphate/cardiolipin synthase family protein [Candidatus Paceibacterota bacterium]